MSVYNNPDRPKILRTQLDVDTHRKFKILSVGLGTTMAEYLEELVRKEVERVEKKGKQIV